MSLAPVAQLDEYLSDDFLFPMTSRLSYASSPESDIDLSPEPRPPSAAKGSAAGKPAPSSSPGAGAGARLVKSSSDPSICTQDELGAGNASATSAGLLGAVGPKFLAQMSGVSLMSVSSTGLHVEHRSVGQPSRCPSHALSSDSEKTR